MEEETRHLFDDAEIEILPPETSADPATPLCACCGRPASSDEDCYGICEECLSQ